ncbi:MAG: class I SAM-dependent methyltransferase [Oscillospiraceae bacterium]|nr:class I SAM-dependent methyltransferase [Oscillospiraceae bacterium]
MHGKPYDYDKIADALFAPLYPPLARLILERTGVHSGRLLDVGCGAGHLGFAVLEAGDFSAADFVDIDPQATDIARQRTAARGLADRVTVQTADVQALPFADGSFDLIVSRSSLQFWADQTRAFSELTRVLRPDGRAYVGGGAGSSQAAAQIQAAKARLGIRTYNGERSHALSCDAYCALLRQLGCVCQVFESPDEGRWLLFGRAV